MVKGSAKEQQAMTNKNTNKEQRKKDDVRRRRRERQLVEHIKYVLKYLFIGNKSNDVKSRQKSAKKTVVLHYYIDSILFFYLVLATQHNSLSLEKKYNFLIKSLLNT